ncbi:MAG: multiheme c-type cytochrome, partial [Planctomycetota bacterium]|nr:multiheme c-type cytochrome [Planctomycetota bacterium]
MTLWIWLCAAAVGIGLLLLTRRRLGWVGSAVVAGGVALLTGAGLEYVAGSGGQVELPPLTKEEFQRLVPDEVLDAGYVGSKECRECHQEQHKSWHDSYHRSITRRPSDEAIIPEFNDQEYRVAPRKFKLFRKGDEFWMNFQDPDELRLNPKTPVPFVDRPVALVTGSHYQQIFWYPTGIPRILGQLPIYHILETEEWVPATAAFLTPPTPAQHTATGEWNANCVECHATFGRPRPTADGEIDTLVAEFGVSCEACHGPGERHVAARRNLPAGQVLALDADPIVNPRRLDHRRSTEVCGVCHSYNVARTTDIRAREKQEGQKYRPGDDFSLTRKLLRPTDDTLVDIRRADGDPDKFFEQRFWRDGMVRTGGHEFNGLAESACFKKGEMSCLSCHDMHQRPDDKRPAKEWANRQMSPTGMTDAACLGCHASEKFAASEHTHHLTDSSGSRCVNCHMPHTDYGLLHAQRSHQISSPRVETQLRSGRPNACNLCHLDQTLGWTADRLREWYSHPRPKLDANLEEVSQGAWLALAGDAGQRALVAS